MDKLNDNEKLECVMRISMSFWTEKTRGVRGSGISVPVARHDNDDDDG